eukprot:m.205510 g.205510  ORF g.205510 m.205510 type:complete len:62 (+) comp18880_c0_seq5:204-389(+)
MAWSVKTCRRSFHCTLSVAVLMQYKAKQDRFATSSLLIKYAIIAAAAVAVVAVLVRLHRRH